MKEIKVVIKLTVHTDDRDQELMDEAVYNELMELMEERELNYTYKVVESDDDEEEDTDLDGVEDYV